MGCATGTVKYLLFIFNFVFAVSSLWMIYLYKFRYEVFENCGNVQLCVCVCERGSRMLA
jgi:hypothetical protein